ncbi:arylphorin-like [Belonocnema kinseyi]|uniref:arylphorin-like n=1 Tax=Belonocnema kinseyi TaxID=2817044 RepID=UPI00143CFDDE|nr:arylphorin-like [Belonocnema kinseyi]
MFTQENICIKNRNENQPHVITCTAEVQPPLEDARQTLIKGRKIVVEDLLNWYGQGLLRPDMLYSAYNEAQVHNMLSLFKVLYYVKDFSTFYQTASWARLHVNNLMFLDALLTAIIYRRDTKYNSFSMPYKIYRITHDINKNFALIHSNDTEEYSLKNNSNSEYKLSYYFEDIGLNAFYLYFRISNPFGKISEIESRLTEATDSGYFVDKVGNKISIYDSDGITNLGAILEGNYDSLNLEYSGSYDQLPINMFDHISDKSDKAPYAPSSLQFFVTSMRHPLFYRITDMVINIFLTYSSGPWARPPHYTLNTYTHSTWTDSRLGSRESLIHSRHLHLTLTGEKHGHIRILHRLFSIRTVKILAADKFERTLRIVDVPTTFWIAHAAHVREVAS